MSSIKERIPVMAEPGAFRVEVTILNQVNGTQSKVTVSVGITIAQLVVKLIKALGLPAEDLDGTLMHYDLTLENAGQSQWLNESLTLAEAGIQEGAVLRIT